MIKFKIGDTVNVIGEKISEPFRIIKINSVEYNKSVHYVVTVKHLNTGEFQTENLSKLSHCEIKKITKFEAYK